MRSVKFGALLMLVGGLLALPHDARAQAAHERDGFWFSAGLGYGTLGCQDCGTREGGFSGNLALGGTLSQKVLLGAAVHAWTKSEDGVTLTASTTTAAVRFYPSAEGGFFLLGGVGLGIVDLEIDGLGSDSETGGAAVLGLGWDLRVGDNVSVTPFWNGMGMTFSDGDANVGQIGVGVTLH